MKLILSTLAALAVVALFTVHPADAACWWNGWGWQCYHPYWHAYWGHPWGYWHHPYWGWHHWRHW